MYNCDDQSYLHIDLSFVCKPITANPIKLPPKEAIGKAATFESNEVRNVRNYTIHRFLYGTSYCGLQRENGSTLRMVQTLRQDFSRFFGDLFYFISLLSA